MQIHTVAVLLATYNGAAHCSAQLSSIMWQCGVNVHVYIRDDGSSDSTTQIVNEWAALYPEQITIVDNQGVSTGSATGNFFALLGAVDFTPYQYVALADQDDVWSPDKLARATRRLSEESADGYSSDLIAFDKRSNAAWMLLKSGRDAKLDYLFQGASAGCTYVLTRRAIDVITEVIEAAPAFCVNASHDWIIYAICRSRHMRWIRDPSAEIFYRQHATNLYGAKQGISELSAKLNALRSKWYRSHILWLQNIVVGSAMEQRVFHAISRGRFLDRLWLIGQASSFRRSRSYVAKLRLAIALRIL
ncbi:glycosyltransferase [Terasakiella pusilla]|uniref:glycosyltransferase n=1 Tax=Terasakiella pusilla TaxID=64973 RepID=UPI003AA9A4E6